MKIIGKSNFDNESVSDVLICENILEGYAKKIVEKLNNDELAFSDTYFYELVEDDYKLYDATEIY